MRRLSVLALGFLLHAAARGEVFGNFETLGVVVDDLRGLEGELGAASNIIATCFPRTSRVKVTLARDPEEDEESPTLVLAMDCQLSRTDFRNARKLFYRRLRSEGCTRLCDLFAVVRG